MSFELGQALLRSDAVTPEGLAGALYLAATRAMPLARALVVTGAVDPARLDEELARAEAPVLRHVVPVPSLVERLPLGLCEALLCVPVRLDAITGTVDLAVVDARDPHTAEEVSHWLDAPVRIVRASRDAIGEALQRVRQARERAAPPGSIRVPPVEPVLRRPTTPSYGTAVAGPPRSWIHTPAAQGPPNIPIPLTRASAPGLHDGGATELAALDEPLPEDGPPTFPFADVGPILGSIRIAPDRDTVVRLLLSGMRTVARRVGLFAVQNGAFVGWDCTPELAVRERLCALRVPLRTPTILAQALLGDGEARLGPMLRTDAHEPFFATFAPPDGEVAVAPIRVRGRPVLVLFADELGDTMIATRRMEELSRAAGDALTRILRTTRDRVGL